MSDSAMNGLVWLIAIGLIILSLVTLIGIIYVIYSFATIYGGCTGTIDYVCMYASEGPYGLPLETRVTCPAQLNKVYNSDDNPTPIPGETRKYASCWIASELEKDGQIPVYKYFFIFKFANT